MKTICGISLRGAVYFYSSCHICIGIIFFLHLMVKILHGFPSTELNGKVEKENVIYIGLFLPLGLLIFKAVDKENRRMLKWSSGAFLLLQLCGVIMRIRVLPVNKSVVIQFKNPYLDTAVSEFSSDNVKYLMIEVLLSALYLIIIYFYVRELQFFPERIATIPMHMYSTSTFFPDHRGNNGHRMTSMSTPFNYNFEPPPPYSSVNNLTMTGSGDGGQQQPCSSRSMFANISRNISFKKNHSNRNSSALGVATAVASGNCPINVIVAQQPSESDSPSAPLLDNSAPSIRHVQSRRSSDKDEID